MREPVSESDLKRLEGKTSLVTGASGFIGSHLVARLTQVPNSRVILLCRQPGVWTNREVHVGTLEALTADDWTKRGLDHFDFVFHLAAFAPKRREEANDWTTAVRDNIQGTQRLLQSLCSFTRFVFASTLDVYAAPRSGESLSEDSATDSTKGYGASKLFCEGMVRAHCTEKGRECAILRYGHIYGPGEWKYSKLIPNVMRQVINRQPVPILGDPHLLRDYLYVADAVEATLRAAVSAEPILGPMNIVRGKSVSVGHVVQTIVKLLNSSCCVESTSHPTPSSRSLCFDNRMMREKLGVWEMVSFEEGLRREIEDFSKHAHSH